MTNPAQTMLELADELVRLKDASDNTFDGDVYGGSDTQDALDQCVDDNFSMIVSALRAAAPVQGAGEPVGWLVEWPEDDNVPVRWWNPNTGWMRDANKAMRFCRECDAANYIAGTGHWTANIKPTEHKFVAHPSSDRPASAPVAVREALEDIARELSGGHGVHRDGNGDVRAYFAGFNVSELVRRLHPAIRYTDNGAPQPRGEPMHTNATQPIGSPNFSVEIANVEPPPNCDEYSYRKGWNDGYNTSHPAVVTSAPVAVREALADKIMADPHVVWLRECGFNSSAKFESTLRAAIMRALVSSGV